MFVDFWPTASPDVEIIADKLNATPKLVFSQTLDRAPWGRWPEAKVVKQSAANEIRDQKQRPGKDMVLWGSLSLAQSLLQEGLIDEVHLRIAPLVLGAGRRLFADPAGRIPLRLLETKSYGSGLVLLRYGQT